MYDMPDLAIVSPGTAGMVLATAGVAVAGDAAGVDAHAATSANEATHAGRWRILITAKIDALTMSVGSSRFSRMVRKFPPWLLIPIGLGLYRVSTYEGDLWWVVGPLALLLDIGTVYVLLHLAERFPLGRGQPRRHLWAHATAAVVFVTTSIALQRAIQVLDPNALPADTLLHLIIGEFVSFLTWNGLAHAIVYLRRYHAAEAASLRVRADLAGAARKRAEAELRSFENEVNPRFLIGALRAAANQVKSAPHRTERLLVEIGDVVRAARPMARSTTLGNEIDALTPFITLERERLNQEIALTSTVESDVLDEPLPPLVLPALVRESLRTASASGIIAVEISAVEVEGPRGQLLQVDVSRTQQHTTRSKSSAEDGVLARTIDHLRSAYEGEAAIAVSRIDNGVRVSLTVPLEREQPPGDTPHSPEDALRPSTPAPRSRTRQMVLTIAFLVLFALNLNTALTRPRFNGVIPPAHLGVIEALHGAAGVTLILYLALRLTRSGFGARMLGAHAATAIGVGLVMALTKWLFTALAGHPYPPHTMANLVGRTVGAVTMYAVLAGVIGAFEYARRYTSAAQKGLRLNAELAEAERRRIEAELRALKAELNPHFLGNALTGASSLLQSDPAAARDVLTKLADVVGSVVSRVGTQEVTLQEELDSLAPFIAVEQSRFGERLSVQWNVDHDARAARVPHLILQPLLENAVKHGLAAPNGGRIVVGGRRIGAQLELTVQDDGVGIEQAKRATGVRRGGIGLSNSRARLEQLYGSDATLQLVPAPEVGTIVKVTLPWR
jgi:two-component system LytT family sensor kinase